jgi:chromate transporter
VIYLRLATVFGLLSIFSFGGGGATVPQMHADVIDQQHWIDAEQFSRFVALATLAPGPLLNIVALIGYTVAGVPGAVVASIAMYAPAAFIVFAIGRVWYRYTGHPWRDAFARGLGPVTLGLFWVGVFAVGRGGIKDAPTIGIAVVVAVLAIWTRINQSLLILTSAGVAAVLLR